MNKIILAGRLTRSPELKTTNTGTEVMSFSLAVDRAYQKNGEEKQVDFINCTAWQKTAVFINQYFQKGDGIIIEGRLESRKYVDKDGNNRTAFEVVIDRVEFPQSKKASNNRPESAPTAPAPVTPSSAGLDIVDDDEEMPQWEVDEWITEY